MITCPVLVETFIDWTAACEVQQRFMQHSHPKINALDYSACCRQVHALGGDFYDFVPLAKDRLAIIVGDASGKGLAAALMSANVQASLRTASFFAADSGPSLLSLVNRQVYESSLADRYATLFYGIFESSNRTLRYVNAGHNPPLLLRRDKSISWLETGGAPIGMFPDWKYEEGVVELHPGDMIIVYTDGITEATDPEGAEWGAEGLSRASAACEAQSAGDILDAILAALDEFTRGSQIDDATVMALQVN